MQEQPPSANLPEQQSPLAAYPPDQRQPQPGYPLYQGQPFMPGYPFQPPRTQPTGKIALKYGLIFGAILVGADLLEFVAGTLFSRLLPSLQAQYHLSFSALALYSLVIPGIFVLIDWVIYFLAGLFTARRAQQVGTATIACLWASLCYFVIYILGLGINVLITWSEITRYNLSVIGYFVNVGTGLVETLILNIGLGIGIGTLGGLLGKSLASKRAQPMPPML